MALNIAAFILTILILCGIFIIIFKMLSTKLDSSDSFDNVAKENYIRLLYSKEFEDSLKDIPMMSYELFRERCLESLLSIINKYKNSKVKIESLKSDLEIDNELKTIFIREINKTMKAAEDIESEAVAYHKTFGEEPDSDPELHPKEPNSNSIVDQENEYKSLEELRSTGTVEDIT